MLVTTEGVVLRTVDRSGCQSAMLRCAVPFQLTCTDNCASKLLNASGQMVKKVSELNPTQIGQPSPVPNR